nr:unnamed protein product [Digitaria exilis]
MTSTAGGGGGEPSRSASAIVANTSRGHHILRIYAYSRTTETPAGEYIKSLPFTAGGHRWCIRYYPSGDRPEAKDYISLYLYLHEDVSEAVKAQFMFRFIRDVGEQALTLGSLHSFDSYCGWGRTKFVKRQDLVASKHLRDDSFTVRCDVVVTSGLRAQEHPAEATIPAPVPMPSSDLHNHLGHLLETQLGVDVAFDVAGQTFAAHRCVLAARSSVFSAELYGVMMESDTGGVVRIDDMDARVFKALLYFIYTDLFPETAKEEGDEGQDEDVMCQHLLVAANRYNLERLKLLCEKRLCDYIDIGTVAVILALAEQHRCHELKKACLDFLRSRANVKAAVAVVS